MALRGTLDGDTVALSLTRAKPVKSHRPDGPLAQHPRLHEPRAGHQRPGDRRAERHQLAGRDDLRDAHRRAAAHGDLVPGGDHAPRMLTERSRPIRSTRESVPEVVEATVQRALEKLPPDRFTVREFAEGLRGRGDFVVFGRSTTARPSSGARRRRGENASGSARSRARGTLARPDRLCIAERPGR
jgi:hypothetical protein